MDKELRGVGSVIALLWLVHAIDWMIPVDFNDYGLVPRTASGLIGIVTMPFLHGNWGHLMSNTVPLAVLLLILCGLRDDVWNVVGSIIIVGGILLWCFGREAVHVGASGLVYGLMGFLIASGFAQKKIIPILVSLVVGFLILGIWDVRPSPARRPALPSRLFVCKNLTPLEVPTNVL